MQMKWRGRNMLQDGKRGRALQIDGGLGFELFGTSL